MGLFGKSCPLDKDYVSIYGIHRPQKWVESRDCPPCEFFTDSKCNYKQAMADRELWSKHGQPVLVKKSMMYSSPAEREKAESEALRKAGFSPQQMEEYRQVSQEYDKAWETSSAEKKSEILDCLGQWKVELEKGASPLKAQENVKEWLRRREEFKKG